MLANAELTLIRQQKAGKCALAGRIPVPQPYNQSVTSSPVYKNIRHIPRGTFHNRVFNNQQPSCVKRPSHQLPVLYSTYCRHMYCIVQPTPHIAARQAQHALLVRVSKISKSQNHPIQLHVHNWRHLSCNLCMQLHIAHRQLEDTPRSSFRRRQVSAL